MRRLVQIRPEVLRPKPGKSQGVEKFGHRRVCVFVCQESRDRAFHKTDIAPTFTVQGD